MKVQVPRLDPRKGDSADIHGDLVVVLVEDHLLHHHIILDKLLTASNHPLCPSHCPPFWQPQHVEADGYTPPSSAV